MSIHVHLERFEGPLGLLLHLIREQEMDIFNINIHQITRQYLEYIKAMRRLDLEIAGEFVAMAATLIHIKSKMLLPNYNEEGEEVEHTDPRKELVQKLLEYKKFQELSADLYKRPLLGRDVFTRGFRADIEAENDGELVLEEKPLFSLIAAYRTAVKNMKKTVHKVARELQSIGARIMEMKEYFIVGKRIVFGDLITDKEKGSPQILITFLSLLELAKMGFVSVFQSEPLGEIHIDAKKTIERDVISQVENYDSVNAEAAAERMIEKGAVQLSLDETVMATADEVGEGEVIVGEASGDAASDDEIFAEEQRLFAEAGHGDQTVVDPVADHLLMPTEDVQPIELVAEEEVASLSTAVAVEIVPEIMASNAIDVTPVAEVLAIEASDAVEVDEPTSDSQPTMAGRSFGLDLGFLTAPDEVEAPVETIEATAIVAVEPVVEESVAVGQASEIHSLETGLISQVSDEEVPATHVVNVSTESGLKSQDSTEGSEVAFAADEPTATVAVQPEPAQTKKPDESVSRAVSSALAAFDSLNDEPVKPRDPEVET